MRSSLKIALAGTLASVSLLSLAAPAMAQEADDEGVSAEGDIIVEARRRDESLQDVPLVVNAVTAEAIEKLNIRDFKDITSVVPGLAMQSNANGIGSTSSMRGINHDVNVSGENGTIQFYYNDVPVASNFVLQAMYDIGQIEVLRGPQGTLRGKATPSGSITVGLRKPDLNEVGGHLQTTIASAGARNFQGALNVPIIADRLAVRIAGLYDIGEGNRVHSINSSVDPERETKSLRASVRAEPFDALKLGFVFQTLQSDSVQFPHMQSFGLLDPTAVPAASAQNYGVIRPGEFKSVSVNPDRYGQNFKFYGWDAQLDVMGQSLIYVGSKLSFTFDSRGPADDTNFFPQYTPTQITHTTNSGMTHELRLQNQDRVAGMFDYVIGYFRSTGHPETRLTTDTILNFYGQIMPGITFPLGASSINTTAIYLPRASGTESSVFGNLTAHIGEATEIAGGLRRIKYENIAGGLYIGCTPVTFAAGTCTLTPGTKNDFKLNKTIYNATIRHRFNDSLMVYAATGTSWRPPVRAIGDFSTSYSANEIEHTTLGAETSKSYEIGFKSDWLDKKLLLNVTAYHQKFKNYPFRAAGAGVYFINVNAQMAEERGQFNFITAVPVKVNGVEAEIAFRPSSRFNLTSTINYSKSKIGSAMLACTDALNNSTGAVGSDGLPDTVAPTLADMQAAYNGEHLAECPTSGGSATYLPTWSGSIQGEYSLPLSDSVDGYLRGLVSWRGKSAIDQSNPYDDVGGYSLINLYAGLRDPDGAWELSFFAKNVTNTKRITSRDSSAISTGTTDVYLGAPTFQSPVGVGSSTYNSRYTGVSMTSPREFGVSARFFFGGR